MLLQSRSGCGCHKSADESAACPALAARPAFGGIREEVSIKNVKNWAKSQKNDFGVKFVKNACFLKDAVLKYITVRRTSDRMKYFKNDVKRRDSTESKMNLKNLSKKRLTIYHESDKISKLSAARLRRTGP